MLVWWLFFVTLLLVLFNFLSVFYVIIKGNIIKLLIEIGTATSHMSGVNHHSDFSCQFSHCLLPSFGFQSFPAASLYINNPPVCAVCNIDKSGWEFTFIVIRDEADLAWSTTNNILTLLCFTFVSYFVFVYLFCSLCLDGVSAQN